MTFNGILFETAQGPAETPPSMADVFVDLNLNQIVAAMTAGREFYDLRPFFLAPLKSLEAIEYRHEVMRDLEDPRVRGVLETFAQSMRTTRSYLDLANKIYSKPNKQGWFLNAVEVYCDAVNRLLRELLASGPRSRGLLAFLEYLKGYAESGDLPSLSAETKKARAHLSAVKYSILFKDNQFTVSKDEGEADYSAEVVKIFQKFNEGEVKDYRIAFSDWPEANRVETAVLEMVARLYPEAFRNLSDYCARRGGFLDGTLAKFDREIQFYFAYLDLIAPLQKAGLQFCYPIVSDRSKEISCHDGFDLALAVKLVREGLPIVCNDFYLKGEERIFVVNGPNQGGKTTFARAFGQAHYFASLGCPVPGKDARLFLFDKLFTHFEREEDLENLRSKLEDDLVRIHSILDESTSRSIVIINEEFSSSTVPDAVFLGRKVLERIGELDALCVYVTFLDELSSLKKTVSLLSTVVPENPDQRTYKILRRPADGRAYAIAIANKYRLSYDSIKERIDQ
jgi:DNA mismatch repair protein MutS